MMNLRRNTLLALSLLNAAAIAGILYPIAAHPSDKSIVVFVFYYPLLVALNAIVWFLMKVFDHPSKTSLKYIVVALLGMAVPLAIVAALL